jgi:hypothetical protein
VGSAFRGIGFPELADYTSFACFDEDSGGARRFARWNPCGITHNGGVAAGYYLIKSLSTDEAVKRLQADGFDICTSSTILAKKAFVLWGRTAFEFGIHAGVGLLSFHWTTSITSLINPKTSAFNNEL